MLKLKYTPKCPKMEMCGTVSSAPTRRAKSPTFTTTSRLGTSPTLGTCVSTVTRHSKPRIPGGNMPQGIVTRSGDTECLWLFLLLDVEAEIQSKMYKDGHIWICCDCSYQSSERTNLRAHIEARHISHSGYQCQFCEKIYKTKDSLRKHVSVYHVNK